VADLQPWSNRFFHLNFEAMKKRTLLASLALTAVLAACGKSEPAATAAAPTAAPVAATKIVVGLDDNFPPMGFRNEKNELVGFDIDMATEATKRLGIEVQFKPIDWSAKEAELNGKRIDVLWNGLTILESRKEHIAFTDPYMANHQIIIVKAGSDITDKAGLAGKVVGVQEASSAVDAMKKEEEVFKSFKEFKQFGDNITALMDLETGRLDAVVVDEVVGRFHVAKKADAYTVLEDNFGTEDYGVGFRKEDTELLGKVNQALKDMKADGAAAEISKKWFGENIVK
jgi:polar amino acid transport system substrate-binding protein